MSERIKHGGRKKGTPNRLTKELRSVLKEVVNNELENLNDNLQELSNKERIEVLVKLIPYVLPKIEPMKHTADEPLEFGWNN